MAMKTETGLPVMCCDMCTSVQVDVSLLFCVTCGSDDLRVGEELQEKQHASGANQWTCYYCTAINADAILICEVCDNEKQMGEGACRICTYVSPSGGTICDMCGTVQ